MKNSVLVLVLFFTVSCRHGMINKNVVIPAGTKIEYVIPREREATGYLVALADTSGDGVPDIKIKVPFRPLIERICFLREIYPSQDIIIGAGNISIVGKDYIFDAGGANVADITKVEK